MTEYECIVEDILKDEEFKKLSRIKHHKGSRMEHVIRVSKKAYKIAKRYNLDYVACARAGLLHDLFEDYYTGPLKDRVNLICNHGKIAKENAERFGLNNKERNIIESHMFPLGLVLPRSREAVLVSLVDKTQAVFEKSSNFKYQYATFFMTLFFILK